MAYHDNLWILLYLHMEGHVMDHQRQINETGFGETIINYVMSRHLDFSFGYTLFDINNKSSTIDLCSTETKPPTVSEEVKTIQLNKNIHVNKMILHLFLQHTSNRQSKTIYTIGFDIVGL